MACMGWEVGLVICPLFFLCFMRWRCLIHFICLVCCFVCISLMHAEGGCLYDMYSTLLSYIHLSLFFRCLSLSRSLSKWAYTDDGCPYLSVYEVVELDGMGVR